MEREARNPGSAAPHSGTADIDDDQEISQFAGLGPTLGIGEPHNGRRVTEYP
jgi:hypothetical protein